MSANDTQVGGTHYKKHKIQHWDYVIANDIPYMEAQVIKYVGRWRDKAGVLDLEKAKHFLEKLIEVEKGRLEYEKIKAQGTAGTGFAAPVTKGQGHTSF
jgi:hypothetical protein